MGGRDTEIMECACVYVYAFVWDLFGCGSLSVSILLYKYFGMKAEVFLSNLTWQKKENVITELTESSYV